MNLDEFKLYLYNVNYIKYATNLKLICNINEKEEFERITVNVHGDEKTYMKTYFYHCNLFQHYKMNGDIDIIDTIFNMKTIDLHAKNLFREQFQANNDKIYWLKFLQGIYENTIFSISEFMMLDFFSVSHNQLYICYTNCICGNAINHVYHIMSTNKHNDVIVILKIGKCCMQRFIGNAKTCIKCIHPCKYDNKKVDKLSKIYMCSDCFNTSEKCKLCNKILMYGHDINECKDKYNKKITYGSKKEKVCTYFNCMNYCKKYDFCDDHIPFSECKHCKIMYKPDRIDNNECNDCFKCNICGIITKEKNKNKHDTRCTKCDRKEIKIQKQQIIIDQILSDRIVPSTQGAASGTIYRCVRCRNIISESQHRIYNRCNRCFASNRS